MSDMQSQAKPESAAQQAHSRQSAPLRIIWLTDGAHVATEPVESTACVIDAKGRVEQRPSCMTSRAIRRATPDEVREWRIRE